jgi:hypothetical protein
MRLIEFTCPNRKEHVMKHDHEKLLEKFAQDGIKSRAQRFLTQYPESPQHLTYRELREQVFYYH